MCIETSTEKTDPNYPDGMSRSNLKWPPMFKKGTMRNINTLTKLVTITEEKPYDSNN
jgi:hypothetical protein